MRFSLLLGTFAALVHSHAIPTTRAAKAPYFILTGDSTTAVNGGWGPGLLPLAQSGAGGVNHAKGGATTVSFRNGGYWDAALKSIASSKANYEPVVTIQFGHNDQKETAGISLTQFQANLEKMAREVISAGGTPIILTSLTRRTFSGGKVVENLKEHSAAAITAARNVGIRYLDLNRASTDYVNAIGSANADYYNFAQGDRTHLNVAGEKVFGRLVADLIAKERTDLKTYLKQNQALSDKIAAGQFATGNESGGGTTPPPTGSCSALWAQCGGSGWTGAACCSQGTCKAQNEWYSQCL